MTSNDIALLEIYPRLPALIESSQEVKQNGTPEHCLFREMIEKLEVAGKLKLLAHHQWEDVRQGIFNLADEICLNL